MGQTAILLLSLLYFVNTSVYILIEYFMIKRRKGISVIFFVRILYILIYGFIPALVHYNYYLTGETVSKISYSANGTGQLYFLYILSIIGYAALNIGYALSNKGKNSPANTPGGNPDNKTDDISIHKLMTAGIITFAIGFLSYYLWSKAYGFPFGIFKYANLLRMGFVPADNPFSFMKYFSTATMFSSFLFFAILHKKDINKIIVFILFALSGFWSVVYLLANDGRMSFIYFFLVFILYRIFWQNTAKQKKAFLKIMIWMAVAFVAMALSDWIMFFLRNGEQLKTGGMPTDVFRLLREELGFTIQSGQTALTALADGLAGNRFPMDILSGLLAFLPSSFRPESIISTSQYNSAFIGMDPSVGETPTDLISMCVYDLGIIGVFILPAVFGWLCRMADNYFAYRRGNNYYDLLFVIISLYLARFITYADPSNFVHNTFFLLIGIVVVRFTNIKKTGRIYLKSLER